MRCSKCGTESTSAKKFCAECGSALSLLCPKCAADNKPTSKFCENCGTPLTGSAAPSTRSPQTVSATPGIRVTAEELDASTVDGERKTVTALFADIKGSTELMEDLDPEEARAIVDPALKLMIDAVHRYDGYIVQSTGDGIFALFGAPVAHEDHPQSALYAAMRMQEEIRRYADRQRAEGRAPIQIRVGVNTGEVVVRSISTGAGQVEYTPIGYTTNLASRMQTLANPGSTVIAESTRKLVEGYFALKPLGGTKVKGVTEPVKVYEVTGLGQLRTRLQRSAGRGLTKFVGREREMEALKYAADQANAGHGQIVAAIAEAGTGKSRLVHEFKAIARSGWTVLEALAVSYGKSAAYFPVVDLLKSYFGIAADDDDRKRREKVAGKIIMLDRSLVDALPYLFALLGIVQGEDPLGAIDIQVRKRKTLESIKRLLLRESLEQPLIVIFEDLHWIDDETQVLLNLLADSIGTAKFLLLVNYRPEYSHQWNSKTYYTQLRLDPLGKESANEMLTAQLGESVELGPLKRLIIEKTEGNPFFMEEMVQALFEEGVLVRNGLVKITGSLNQFKTPPTVQGIIDARIDRLPPDGKELLQTLAAIGREFAFGLLRNVVAKSEDELNRLLYDLQVAEFIYEQPAVGDVEYTFKHALTHEVAYNSILSKRRKMLHERVALAVESLYGSSLDDHVTDLARHYSRSENGEKAVEYLGRAGEQSVQRAAYAEAKPYLDDGLERVRALPESLGHSRAELRIQIAEGQLFRETIGTTAPAAIVSFNRARELCTMIGDDAQLFPVLDGLRRGSLFRLETEKARHFAEEQMVLAGRSNDPVKSALASGALGEVLCWIGDFAAARRYLEPVFSPGFSDLRGIELDHLAVCRSLSALVLVMLGFVDQANKRRDETLAWAQGFGFPVPTADAFLIASMSDSCCRSSRSALEHSKISIEISTEHGTKGSSAFTIATIMNGWALSYEGKVDEGIAVMQSGIAAAESTGMLIPTWGLLPLAEAYLRAGRLSKSGELVNQMLDRMQSTGHRQDEAEIYRLKGEASLILDKTDNLAEKCFRRAIEVARGQSGKLYELRATVSLSRLLVSQGHRDDARAMLVEIYNWFTEGFDTADLKDAKSLLDELNR